MKFKGRNGGMAIAIHNHIMLFRVFVILLLISIIPPKKIWGRTLVRLHIFFGEHLNRESNAVSKIT